MKALAGVLLLAACGGSSSDVIDYGGGYGSKHYEGPAVDHVAVIEQQRVDPAIAARQAFVNPGGMWMPQQLGLPVHTEAFAKLGVALDAKALTDPLGAPLAAMVSIGGCSASFVSADGLVITNHHCVQGALQLNSTESRNLVTDGFLAKTRVEELSAGPAQRVYVPLAFSDVTAKMTAGIADITDANKRHDEIEARQKAIQTACEQGKPGHHCTVRGYFRGGQYILTEQLEIRDVRLVYVPARGIGNFGGEIDNWAWPRTTADFSFYRAYVGPDGQPADFAAANVPYHPAHFLKVSTEGVKPSDFVMVTGYPGTTNRTELALDTHHRVDWTLPYTIEHYKQTYALAEAHLRDAGETGIKAAVMKQGVQNRLEKSQGVLAGLTQGDLITRKDALDAKVRAWAAQPGHETYAQAIARYEALVAKERPSERVDADRSGAYGGGSKLLGAAFTIMRWAQERQKPDAERRAGYQDRDLPRAVGEQRTLAKRYDAVLDRETMRLELVRALGNPDDAVWLGHLLGVAPKKLSIAAIDKTLDTWYASPKLVDNDLRVDLIQTASPKQLKARKDPFFDAVLRAWPDYTAAELAADARGAELQLAAPLYVEAMRQVLGGELAPDANGTLRVTYGTVRALRDGTAQTHGADLLARATDQEPFNAPAREVDALKAKQLGPYADASGDLPLDFLSDLDITNGNSGSATLDGRGELVGLAFDGNIEGTASDLFFDSTSTRTIHCDIRYVLWLMDKVDGADALLTEMGITPTL